MRRTGGTGGRWGRAARSAGLCWLLIFAGCGDRAARQTILISGSSTVAPLAAEIGKRFEASNPGVRIDVQSGGSSRGSADARARLVQIGMISRGLSAAESDLTGHLLARDGIVLITHRDRLLEDLSREQVIGIFTGRLSRWSAIGDEDDPITVVHKAEGRSTNELFLQHFGLRNGDVRPHVVIGDNAQGLLTVAGNRGAIGYVSFGAAQVEVRRGAPLRILRLDGIAPSREAIQSGSWPLSRPLLFVVAADPDPLVARFLTFATSAAVEDLIEAQSFVAPHR